VPVAPGLFETVFGRCAVDVLTETGFKARLCTSLVSVPEVEATGSRSSDIRAAPKLEADSAVRADPKIRSGRGAEVTASGAVVFPGEAENPEKIRSL
jgi:hypothetical protein